MTRIVAGSAGGRTLRVPAGSATRPTSDRVREALFSRLEHQGVVRGSRVADLYAGSGALGLEAASRGAAAVLLVDSAAQAAAACRRNARDLRLAQVEVRRQSLPGALAAGPEQPYDVVLLDPPYELAEDVLAEVLHRLVTHRWVAAGGLVVVERSTRSPEPGWPEGLARVDERRYGETRLWFAESAGPGG